MFAKLFESEKYGQIAVIVQDDEEGNPEIRFFAEPPNYGVCSIAISYFDGPDKSGLEYAKGTLKGMNLEWAENIVKSIYDFVV